MKKILILFIIIFRLSIHATTFEKVPMPIKLKIFELVANNEENLKCLWDTRIVSKQWYSWIIHEETKRMAKEQKLLLRKKEIVYKSQTQNSCTCWSPCGGGSYCVCNTRQDYSSGWALKTNQDDNRCP